MKPTVEIPREDAERLLKRIFEVQEKMDQENQNVLYVLLNDISLVLDSALEGV